MGRVPRVREVEALDFGLAFDVDVLVEGRAEVVLLLREPVGEDVRVAMLEG